MSDPFMARVVVDLAVAAWKDPSATANDDTVSLLYISTVSYDIEKLVGASEEEENGVLAARRRGGRGGVGGGEEEGEGVVASSMVMMRRRSLRKRGGGGWHGGFGCDKKEEEGVAAALARKRSWRCRRCQQGRGEERSETSGARRIVWQCWRRQ
jgi:hypothetical protein